MIKILILFYPVLFFVSCSNESQPGTRSDENTVTVSCKCKLDTEFVRGKGSSKAEAKQSAQEKCSILFPSATVKNCQTTSSQ